ncbi:DNA-3-methyladenine glycosylase family protein [Paludibacterium yongneupense]|uniref:DNA-3-methyladenine glycosylase family protein n=1 Tax=Paludibacterium yongneupense TaxID=400061 RepID=UPI00041220F5|nr:DNA-3-methyladenine glycosylase 2 [Paludibacterium yongneupense]
MPVTAVSCHIDLPPRFRRDVILPFHRRDTQQLSERADDTRLDKGMIWKGAPARLGILCRDDGAEAVLEVDGSVSDDDRPALEDRVRRMLGLTQPIDEFERTFGPHPELGALIARQSGLRVAQTASPFEAIAWAVTGQQISVAVAVSLRRRLIQRCGVRHSGGLYCHPDAARVAELTEDDLRACGFSAGKAHTLLTISRMQSAGELPLDDWLAAPPIALMRERLSSIKGIGPWTISYTLLRAYAWLDGSLHGDVAVRRGIQQLLKQDAPLSDREARLWLQAFAPWRALVAAHLWASLQVAA